MNRFVTAATKMAFGAALPLLALTLVAARASGQPAPKGPYTICLYNRHGPDIVRNVAGGAALDRLEASLELETPGRQQKHDA